MYVEKRGCLLYNQGVKERASMQARHALFQLWGAFPIMGLIAALQQPTPPMPWGIVASWWLSRSKTSLSLSGMRQVSPKSTKNARELIDNTYDLYLLTLNMTRLVGLYCIVAEIDFVREFFSGVLRSQSQNKQDRPFKAKSARGTSSFDLP